MSYIGNPPAESYTNTVKDSFSGDGSTTAFTLSRPSLTNDVRVVVENVIQDPTVAYSVSGTTLTFTSAPPSGTNNIYVVHLGPAIQTAVPPGEISAATTFASNVTVQGAFTSRGIDDNADAVAMTIDSSENVLVGKTSSSGAVVGCELQPVGFIRGTRDGGAPLGLNRKSSDGAIAVFEKDSVSVGSIGVDGNALYLGTADTGIRFAGGSDAFHPFNPSTLADRDNAVDIGLSTIRFKDLYLSGGVYLGGTGSANYLDDYEEGTWTPTITATSGNPTITYNNNIGYYVKVGQQVTVWMFISFNAYSGGSGVARVSGLPFTQSGSLAVVANAGLLIDNLNVDCRQVSIQGDQNSSLLTLIKSGGATASHAGLSASDLTVSSQIRSVFSYFI